ncbi:MAG: helix-turn-helix domain-containing protein [Sedimentisphaerales bacterium]|nr:helix-turn-helix domain-containing protein [Sedimentisphaerales bacterium]
MELENEKLLLKPDEVAKTLSICPRSLWTLTRQGKIPCVRINRSVRYDPRDIAEFINNQKKQAC